MLGDAVVRVATPGAVEAKASHSRAAGRRCVLDSLGAFSRAPILENTIVFLTDLTSINLYLAWILLSFIVFYCILKYFNVYSSYFSIF